MSVVSHDAVLYARCKRPPMGKCRRGLKVGARFVALGDFGSHPAASHDQASVLADAALADYRCVATPGA